MRELSLFTGAGGRLLGTKLLGWECIGYVESETYCQRVIEQRIADGVFDRAPIFNDIREFIESGAADQYKGIADVVSAGFPCQPFSVAGKREGTDDERNMWPQTIECIRRVRPRFALLENVPGLLTSGYFGTILGDLAEIGYSARWICLSAAEIGAPHRRNRLWILAYPNGARKQQPEGSQQEQRGRFSNGSIDLADATGERVEGMRPQGEQVSEVSAPEGVSGCSGGGITWWERDPADVRDATGEGLSDWGIQSMEQPCAESKSQRSGITHRRKETSDSQSRLGRVADGVANRSHRLKAIGNGQVPGVVAAAWILLSEGLT